jgi:foldase protein PrsA
VKKLLVLVALGAVLFAACGGGSGSVAATVDGTDVTVGDVEALIDTDGAAIAKDQFAQFLTYKIQWIVVTNAAADDYGVVITDEEAAAEADRIYDELAEQGQSREDFVASRGVTEQFLQDIAEQGLIDTQLRELLKADADEPTPEEIDQARVDATTSLTNVCASHILVATEEEANDIFTRLDAGEEFGALAAELSTDTTSGANDGALGCSSPDSYVEPFADAIMVAPVGEVYDQVVQTQYGFHVILVTDRTEPAQADIPSDEDLVSNLKDQAVDLELQDWFLASTGAADVTVDEAYGTWQPNPPTVVAPTE